MLQETPETPLRRPWLPGQATSNVSHKARSEKRAQELRHLFDAGEENSTSGNHLHTVPHTARNNSPQACHKKRPQFNRRAVTGGGHFGGLARGVVRSRPEENMPLVGDS